MTIYGTAVLSFCLLTGLFIGRLLGKAFHVDKDIGGVGIAMILVIVVTGWLRRRDLLAPASESGISFWSSIYIPVIVAMAATQDVRGALNASGVAAWAGALVVLSCFALLPLISRLGKAAEPDEPRSE